MRKFFTFLVLASIALTFSSCDEDQLELDTAIIEQYLTDNNLTAEQTPEGVYYIITEEGNGEKPVQTSTVKVNYKGYLTDGTVFDSGQQIEFSLGGVIAGWRIGIPQIEKSGSGTLIIPSTLGYGGSPVGAIPANSVLIFEVDLLDIK